MITDKENEITPPGWYLEAEQGSEGRYSIPIDKDPFLIGRRQDCHLILTGKDVSRIHAKIFSSGSFLFIRDLNSTNGTFINTKKIRIDTKLKPGDTIQFGSIEFKIRQIVEDDEDEHTATFITTPLHDEQSFFERYNYTAREQEIFFLIIEGKSTKEIGEVLFISPGTAKNHVLSIFKKTKVHSRMLLMTKYLQFTHEQSNKKTV
ncbi:MAG: FHA domain-containing protein [Spirochaetales bacterium]|nr:FHA domain-containing protein [Spirochaetales bacterium]